LLTCSQGYIVGMNLAFLRRPRDTPALTHTAEADPDTAHILRLLSRSPIITELVADERDAQIVAREELLAEITQIRDDTAASVARLSAEAAAARKIALDLHRQ
jgi:hypothetical protein